MDKETHTAFKTLTDLIKVQIESLDIVLPRRYSILFSDLAKANKIDLSGEEVINNELLDDKVVKHVEKLSDSATKAVTAIETNDAEKLQEVLTETQALREEIEQLRSAVYEDTLTKVYNRRWMEEHYLNSDKTVFVVNGMLSMIDMNDFKHINDTFGHISGDKVLFYVASQLRRSGGHVIRFGGDEFFVLFEDGITKDKANLKLHNIRELVIKKQLRSEGKTFKTSFSYGLVEFSSGDTVESVVHSADEEMYNDKIQIKSRLNK